MTDMVTVKLHAVAHGRTGDKGNRVNISLIPYREEAWPHLLEQVTADRVRAHFSHKSAAETVRYELPNLPAMNFVIDGVLEGGVNAALDIDTHGKSLAFHLLDMEVTVPRDCLLHR